MDILKALETEFKIKPFQVENTVKLIDEGNTIPFIARYRKELTGSLDDQVLRELYERLLYLRNFEEKKEQYKAVIAEQGKLTDEIAAQFDRAVTLSELEDIYRPFRPKRRTRATIAKEKGLEPLAALLWAQALAKPAEEYAAVFINAEKEVATAEEALSGACDIIAEMISDDANFRGMIRKETFKEGLIVSKATDEKKESVYEMYYDFQEPVKKIAG
ncbi:MAG: RNA-binding transcriptional accessory protein, partial [Clostridiales bacterium]|nr:RNA-binding transcriptional accessory protein [Clostridiales bacterium]